MDKYLIRTPRPPLVQTKSSKRNCEEINVNELPTDPMDRRRISNYNPNDRERVRRAYLLRGPYQPRDHVCPQKLISNIKRRFKVEWFELYKPWLEYSVKGDAAFCLVCYLWADSVMVSKDTSFTIGGFSNWKKTERFVFHIGGINSFHNQCRRKCDDLMTQNQHIAFSFAKQSDQTRMDYVTRLIASIDCVRFLLRRGLAFRGHDESDDSIDMGNFKELLQFLANHNEEIGKVVLGKAPRNNKLSSSQIQLDITSACAYETTKAIVEDIGGEHYSILVDESRDASTKEQMSLVVRYVDKKGHVIERFLGIVHVSNTTSLSLKEAIQSILARLNLSMSQIRGQGYDGASNMRGEFNGLKSLILKENSSAYYVHCFAHQLQLVLVAVAKNDPDIASLFAMIGSLVNVVGASCKRRDMLREEQAKKIEESIGIGDIESGKGLNQECTLQRATDTRWSSHCNSLINIGILFPSIIEVLGYILKDAMSLDQRGEAKRLLTWLLSFDFAFTSILMKKVLQITNVLALTLQKKDVDIVNAIKLVDIAKQRLETLRKDGWEALVKEVSAFCHKYNINIPKMDDAYELPGRPRRVAHKVTILHHYEIDIFKSVIDWVLQELNSRFSEVTTELLVCMACLNPNDSFASFNKDKLVRLTEFYPLDFTETERVLIEDQLETFLLDMKTSTEFADLKGVGCLAAQLVKTNKHEAYRLVYRLIKLILVLPVSTASVERSFSAMKIVKNRLRNKMSDDWMNDCLVTYIEKEVFKCVETELIVDRFQSMKPRRFQLPKKA